MLGRWFRIGYIYGQTIGWKRCGGERLRKEKNKEREVSRRLLEGWTREARKYRDTLLRDISRSLLEIKDKTRLSVAALTKILCSETSTVNERETRKRVESTEEKKHKFGLLIMSTERKN